MIRRYSTLHVASTILAALLFVTSANFVHAQDSTTSISYQGRILLDGVPVNEENGSFTFELYDMSGQTPSGLQTISTATISVEDGLFTIPLAFSSSYFDGRELGIKVTYTDTDDHVFPIEDLTAVPYALYAQDAKEWDGEAAMQTDIDGKVSKTGATMTGTLILPTNGLSVGSGQLVANSGRVGVNTSLPEEPLHVRADSAGDALKLEEYSGGEDWTFTVDDNGELAMEKDGVEKVWLNSNGRIGVGINPQDVYNISIAGAGGVGGRTNNERASLLTSSTNCQLELNGYHVGPNAVKLHDLNGGDVGIAWVHNDFKYRWRIYNAMDGTGGDLGSDDDLHITRYPTGNGSNGYNVLSLDYPTGNVGVGISDPQDKLDVNGVIRLENVGTEPTVASGCARLYAYGGYLKASDASGNQSIISPHRDPREVDPNALTSFRQNQAELPWSFDHANTVVGKGATVDMAKLVSWVEGKMQAELGQDEGKVIYSYDLPADRIVTADDVLAERVDALINEKIEELGWIEVPLVSGNQLPVEAWEEVEETTFEEVTETYTENEIDWETASVVEVEKERTTLREVATGETVRQLRDGYKFEEGKLYRRATVDDIDIRADEVRPLPEWVLDRARNRPAANPRVDEIIDRQLSKARADKEAELAAMPINSNVRELAESR